ncbi:molybdopterin-dependent oxidoreductase [Shewanella gaetbuli]|uniref:Molybdopterin-dependent oxidoreductase n=1 Tax=Shewanella gaetbuli TaxID=220752 RepID=A0A9X1ZRY5_9GAMM|nr:molybdopterin-dependent oxidoreductase [Shewanella gaetbuli]MCL1144310.1 molybdopterin-dependent oxidoreductase [Shewanella gaetbuli]
MAVFQSSCAYCGVGCGLTINHGSSSNTSQDMSPQLDEVQNSFTLAGDESHPANFGRLCAKGERLLESLPQPTTLRYPRLSSGKVVDWDDATQLIAEKFIETREKYGPNSVALYLSGQLLTEDYYVANKFAKGYLQTANVDTNSRLCMSSAVSAMQRSFGEDVVPGCYEDLEQAEVIVLIGANTAWTHPVLFQRILAAKKTNNCQLVVIDPINTATAKQADLHLAINPGADLSLFSGLLGYLADNDKLNPSYIEAHTEGFDKVIKPAQKLSANLPLLAKRTGIKLALLEQFFELFASKSKVLTASCQGVNQSIIGTDCTNAIINCHLALGQIGQVGSGFFSLTGQPNAMGGREVGGLATQLASHMGFSPQERQLLTAFWGCDDVAKDKGLTAVEMFDAVADGTIKAIWIMATNPAVSLPNSDKVAKALADCPFVVVSEVIPDTDTAKLADVLLPAQGWSEKCGTVTNSERTITRQRGFTAPKGQSKPDWWAISQVATKMGFSGFDFEDNAAVFKEHAQLSAKVCQTFPQKKFNLAGLANLSKAQYDALLPTQWPVTDAKQIGQQHTRVFTDGEFATPSAKAQFVAAESIDVEPIVYDSNATGLMAQASVLLLNSGRSRDQWHTMTRTGHIASLRASVPEPLLVINPTQLTILGLYDSQLVKIKSASSAAESSNAFTAARVKIDADVPVNLAFMSMHWSKQFSLTSGVNQAISAEVDPVSKQPGFKCQPVALSPLYLSLQGVVFGLHDDSAQGLCWHVPQTLSNEVCHHIAFEHEQDGFAYQATPHSIKWTLSLTTEICADQLLHIQCNLEKGRLTSLKILSDKPVQVALEPMNAFIGEAFDSQLLKQIHAQIRAGNSPLVCACTGVSEADISNELSQHFDNQMMQSGIDQLDFNAALDNTQSALGCGRQCGSCNSEVKQCATTIWQDALSFVVEQAAPQSDSAKEDVA